MRAATGTQYELTNETPNGRATATITEVAAGIRAYTLNGIDLVETFAAAIEPPMSAGIVLVPWPNRIRDGIWLHGEDWQQLGPFLLSGHRIHPLECDRRLTRLGLPKMGEWKVAGSELAVGSGVQRLQSIDCTSWVQEVPLARIVL